MFILCFIYIVFKPILVITKFMPILYFHVKKSVF